MTLLDRRSARAGLRGLLAPRGLAVIGVSSVPGKLGWAMRQSLKTFPGSVLAVNARHPDPASGVYSSVTEAVAATGTSVDLAVSCVPAAATADAVRDAAAAGAGAVIVCAGGFAEAGAKGQANQEALAAVAQETGVRIIGPNTSGLVVPARQLVASFVPGAATVPAGPVAVVAASGGVNHAVAFALADHGVGVRLAVGLGNAFDTPAADILDLLADDDHTSAVALALESVTDGRALAEAVARLVPSVPVVALIVGRADVSDFARSHTGALATSWRTARAALRQAGAVLVDDERDLVDAVSALSMARLPRAHVGIGVVTAQAGAGMLLADALRSSGVDVPRLQDSTVAALGDLLPPLTYQGNPVDTGRPGDTFSDVVTTVSRDPAVDLVAVYALLEPGVINLPAALVRAASKSALMIAATSGPPIEVRRARQQLTDAGIPAYATPTAAAVAVRALVADAARGDGLANLDVDGVGAQSSTGRLDEHEGKQLLTSIGIAVPRGVRCQSPEEANAAYRCLRPPLVAKMLDANVLHKTELGGVHLDIMSAGDLDAAVNELAQSGVERYLVEEMAPAGVDLLVAARRDVVFGPTVVVAAGGTAAELLDDVAIRLAPVSAAEAARMIDELALAPLLRSGRGSPAVDTEALGTVISALGDLLVAQPAVSEIEINPLRATADGRLVALDVVVIPSAVEHA